MARSIEEIQNTITSIYVSEMAAIGYIVNPTTWSKTNLIRLTFFIVATAVNYLEQLVDMHQVNTDAYIKSLLPPTREWYANKALQYQHGFPLLPVTFEFDNTGYTDAQVAASKKVMYAAVIKQVNDYGNVLLRIKVAGVNGNNLEQLPTPIVDGLREYFQRIGPAGDNLSIESNPADKLKMKWRVYYNPLILNADGGRLDGQNSGIVRKTIKQFLVDGIPFSGTYVPTYHIDYLQRVPGVVIPEIIECAATYGELPFSTVSTMYEPNAGWLRFSSEDDLVIEYVAQTTL